MTGVSASQAPNATVLSACSSVCTAFNEATVQWTKNPTIMEFPSISSEYEVFCRIEVLHHFSDNCEIISQKRVTNYLMILTLMSGSCHLDSVERLF